MWVETGLKGAQAFRGPLVAGCKVDRKTLQFLRLLSMCEVELTEALWTF